MWIVKKIITIGLFFLSSILFPLESRAEKKIGIFTFAEEARFTEVSKGVMDQLREKGFDEPSVKYILENAGGSKAKAAELAQKFAEAKMDLMITIGTTATVVTAKAITDVPIVFGLVYDPVESGIAKDWKSSGNNTTGASSRVPISILLDSLKRLSTVKKLAVLYTPGEKHTEVILKEFQKLEADSKIKIVPVIIATKEDIAQILPEILRTVDAISLFGSSIYYQSIPEIMEMAAKAKVISITHVEEYVEKGALLGVCPNPYKIGLLAGEKAVMILKGAQPSSIPIEPLNTFDVILNKKTVAAGKFLIPPDFMKVVTKTVE